MNHSHRELSMLGDPRQILGVGLEATDDDVRAAYLRRVKEFPPDRSPAEFERIRDAYELLRDRRRRMHHLLLAGNHETALSSLLDGCAFPREFTMPQIWLEVLREK